MCPGGETKMDSPVEMDAPVSLNEPKDLVLVSLQGIVYSFRNDGLMEYPETRLGAISENDPAYNQAKRRYEFDRSPSDFMDSLVTFYRDGGDLHLPANLCHGAAKDEMAFWGIQPELLAPCCFDVYEEEEDGEKLMKILQEILRPSRERIREAAVQRARSRTKPSSVGCADKTQHQDESAENVDLETIELELRDRIWIFFEDPHSSKWAMTWSLFVGFAVWLSVLSAGFETLPVFREWHNTSLLETYNNMTEGRALFLHTHTSAIIYVPIVEAIGTFILLIDLCGYFFACRNKRAILKCFMYPLQAFIVVASIAILSRQLQPNSLQEFQENMKIILTIGVIIKILHVVLLTKLTRNYRLLFLLFMSIQKSWREMALLVMVMGLGVMAFSVAMYYAELETGTFDTMLDSYWWATVTMTTVGYGDYTPTTVVGRCISSACFVCGVIVIAIPVAVIGSNFGHYYNMLGKIDRLNKRNARRKKYCQGKTSLEKSLAKHVTHV